MSRVLRPALQTALSAPGRFAMALCIDITRSDGAVYHYTSWDVALQIDSDWYSPTAGVQASKVENNGDAAVDQMQVTVLLDTADITEADVLMGKWHGAQVRLFMVNAENASEGALEVRTGWLGNISVEDGQAKCEFLGLMQHLQSTIGKVVTKTCLNEFCGPIDANGRGCGLSLASFTTAATVTGWDPDGIVIDSTSLTSYPNGEFNEGKVTFDAQPWISFGVKFSYQASGILVLKEVPPFTVTPGMTFTVSRGCTKEFDFCVNSRSNGARFNGFPHLKGNDKLLQFGRRNGS